jgi:hypothetical protein
MKYGLVICVAALGCNSASYGVTSLVGTWELAGAVGSAPQGTLLLTSSRLSINLGGDGFDLKVDGTPTFSWVDHGASPSITATHTNGSFNGGALPLGIGGDWTFSGTTGGSCSASLQSASFVGDCAGVGYGSPIDLNRHAIATRIKQLDSAFGDLGGTWTVSDSNGGSLMATLQGATVRATLSSGGGITVTFGDGMASGTTDSGAEFSARRQ